MAHQDDFYSALGLGTSNSRLGVCTKAVISGRPKSRKWNTITLRPGYWQQGAVYHTDHRAQCSVHIWSPKNNSKSGVYSNTWVNLKQVWIEYLITISHISPCLDIAVIFSIGHTSRHISLHDSKVHERPRATIYIYWSRTLMQPVASTICSQNRFKCAF